MNPSIGHSVARALAQAVAGGVARAVGFERLLEQLPQQTFAYARIYYSTFILSSDSLLVCPGSVLSVQNCVAQRSLLLALHELNLVLHTTRIN